MKRLAYILSYLVVISACQQSTEYDAFVDQNQQGKEIFLKEVDFCKKYADLHAVRNEGSQAAGERFIQKQKIFYVCMEKKQWVPKH
jgi:hypothetical protein